MIWNKFKLIDALRFQEDTEKLFELKEVKQTRSILQNRLYFGYLDNIKKAFEEIWIFITVDDLHDWLKTKLLNLACAAIKTRYDAWSVRYFTNKTLLGLVNSNGKLKFNFI